MASSERAIDAVTRDRLPVQPLRALFRSELAGLSATTSARPTATGRFESYTGRGRFFLARALVDGVIDYDAEIAAARLRLHRVPGLRRALLQVPSHDRHLRGDEGGSGRAGACSRRTWLPGSSDEGGLGEYHNVYQAPQEDRLAWLPDSQPRGQARRKWCSTSAARRPTSRQNMALDTYVAAGKGRRSISPCSSDEWCCGHPYLAAGQPDKARAASWSTPWSRSQRAGRQPDRLQLPRLPARLPRRCAEADGNAAARSSRCTSWSCWPTGWSAARSPWSATGPRPS